MIFLTIDDYTKRSADSRYVIRTIYGYRHDLRHAGPWHYIDFEGRRIGECASMEKAEQRCREHAR